MDKQIVTVEQLIEGQQMSRKRDLGDLKRMIDGDHWLEGRGWVGPRPEGEGADRVMEAIKDQFVFKNVVAEVCRRHRDSVVGREPAWRFVPKRSLAEDEEPSEEELAAIDEAEAALTQWFDEFGVASELQEATMYTLWAKSGFKSRTAGPLRVYVPAANLETDKEGNAIVPEGLPLAETVSLLRVSAENPMDAGVVLDRDGIELFAYMIYRDGSTTIHEVVGTAKQLSKLGALKGIYEPDTTVVQQRVNGAIQGEVGYDIGGRLLTTELMRRETLITSAMISQQKLMNMAYTMTGRNVVQGGFLERLILNAQVPGKWYDNEGNLDPENGTVFKPDPMHVGAGTTNMLTGLEIHNEDEAHVGYTTPSVVYRDPVPVTTFSDTIDLAKMALYEEGQQIHVLISGDSTTSGQSRIQATNDFVSSLILTAGSLEKGLRHTLETVLAMSAYLSGQEERFSMLRAEVTCLLSAVQPSPDEIRAVIEQYNAGLLSRETAMSRNGVEDVDAEQQKINTEIEQGLRGITEAYAGPYERVSKTPPAKTENEPPAEDE